MSMVAGPGLQQLEPVLLWGARVISISIHCEGSFENEVLDGGAVDFAALEAHPMDADFLLESDSDFDRQLLVCVEVAIAAVLQDGLRQVDPRRTLPQHHRSTVQTCEVVVVLYGSSPLLFVALQYFQTAFSHNLPQLFTHNT